MPVTTNGTATVTIGTLPGPGDLAAPADGLGTITKLQYRVNGGPVYDLPSVSTTAFSIDLAIWAGATVPVDVRAVSATGNGPWSTADTATVTGSALAAPTGVAAIGDVMLQEETGVLAVPTAAAFGGGSRAYSLDTALVGLSINASTGVVSIDSAKIGRRLDTPIVVRAHNGAGTVTRTFLLSVGPQLALSLPTGDLSGWTTTEQSTQFARMVSNGMAEGRVDFYRPNIEISSGVYSWAEMDGIVERGAAVGMKMHGILLGTPTWTGQATNALPLDAGLWRAFCQAAANRYNGVTKPLVASWECWNEQNADFASPFDNGSLFVARALAPMFEGVKAGNPSAIVLNGGQSNKSTAGGDDSRTFFAVGYGRGELLSSAVDPGFPLGFYGVYTLSLTNSGTRIRITNGAADYSGSRISVSTIVGKAYRFRATSHGGSAGGTVSVSDATGNLVQYYGAGSFEGSFVARHAVTTVFIATNTNVLSDFTEFSGFSFWEADVRQVCDAHADHPYIDTVWPSTATWDNTSDWMGTEISRDMRAIAVANGDDRPFWTTEFGGATQGTNGATRNPMTEANQAAMFTEAFRKSCVAERWRKKLYVYSWADRGGAPDLCENWFGIVGPKAGGWVAKPALAALAAIKRGT